MATARKVEVEETVHHVVDIDNGSLVMELTEGNSMLSISDSLGGNIEVAIGEIEALRSALLKASKLLKA